MYIFSFLLAIVTICFFFSTMIYRDMYLRYKKRCEKYRKVFKAIVAKGHHKGIYLDDVNE